jgi:hypothetical protein
MMTSVLLSDRDREAEWQVISAVAQMETRLPSVPPEHGVGFDLATIRARPAICTIVLPSSLAVGADLPDVLGIITDMETCLAAAYFEALAARR